ncbi:hypothetical protein D3C76_1577620 [compost metagenome]
MAHTFVKNVNAYVEAAEGYKADSIKVELNESTFEVIAYPVDVAGARVAGAANLVEKTLTGLSPAIVYYEEIIHQLEQGDVIRNV